MYTSEEQPKVQAHHSCLLSYRVHSWVSGEHAPHQIRCTAGKDHLSPKQKLRQLRELYSRLVQFKQSENTYIWTWSKAEVPLHSEVFKHLASCLPPPGQQAALLHSSTEDLQSHSLSLSMTDRRFMLEKFNSHNYIKNEGTTFQDKRTKYKDTGPDQHTATITAEYSKFYQNAD